jgi:acetoin utilization deacetylase AcuC-like enzyme
MDTLIYFYPQGHEAHAVPNHPERPERVEAIRTALEQAGWWHPYPKLEPLPLPESFLRTVHSSAHLHRLQSYSLHGGYMDPDTYLTRDSWHLALRAAGGGVAVADSVWQRRARRGFALTRPPGHHATPTQAMGFCLLNNIALAAEHLIQQRHAQRLAIVDIDLHHGNGTQDIFYHRGEVLFVSTHQSPLYPGSGHLNETGQGKGEGTTVNLPFPPLSGDQAYLTALEEVILPLLVRFNPEMILMSVGMDAHWRDPLGNLLLSAETYHRIVSRLTLFSDESCQGRIALFLEGGYDLEAGSACAAAAVAALLDEPFDDPIGRAPWKETSGWRRVVTEARRIHGLA